MSPTKFHSVEGGSEKILNNVYKCQNKFSEWERERRTERERERERRVLSNVLSKDSTQKSSFVMFDNKSLKENFFTENFKNFTIDFLPHFTWVTKQFWHSGISVTRLCEISPLWHTIRELWPFWKRSFSIWHYLS